MGTQSAATATPLHLLRMTDGLIVHQSLCAAAKLGIADLVKDGARSTTDLAATLQVNDDALYRTLRFLAGQGVFHEVAPHAFANNTLSEWLRSEVPGSIRSILIYRGSPFYFSSFGDLLYTIETGVPAREKAHRENGFEQLRRNPDEGRMFDDAMTDLSMLWAPSISAAYDFGRWGSLMDVGGGSGLLLATIMKAHPALRGVLADQPQVLERARQRGFWSPDLTGRVRFEPADFFRAVPSGCRAYLMKNIIHDWDDERARGILLNCRRAIPHDGVLLLVEYCLGGENTPTLGKAIDVVMLTMTGGKERTVREHRELLSSTRFCIRETVPIAHDVMIIEARPAS
jgi:hypothetical protein